MPYELIGKIILLILSSLSVIFSLLVIAKKKKHFQIFPDDIKKDYYKTVRNMSIANGIASLLIILSLVFYQTNFVYFILVISMAISIGALYSIYDEFGEFDE
jgi:hypothetical protein